MSSVKDWTASVIKQAEIDKYLDGGRDFIDEEQIFADIEKHKNPDKQQVRDITKIFGYKNFNSGGNGYIAERGGSGVVA